MDLDNVTCTLRGVCIVDWLARSISLTISVLEHHEYDLLDELLPYTCFVRSLVLL